MPSVLQPNGHICQIRGGDGFFGSWTPGSQNTVAWQNQGGVDVGVLWEPQYIFPVWADGTMLVRATFRPDTNNPGSTTMEVHRRASGAGGVGSVVASDTQVVPTGANATFTSGTFSVSRTDQLIVTFNPTNQPGFTRGSVIFVYQ